MTVEIITPEALAAVVGQSIQRIACELRPDVLDGLYRAVQSETSERGRTVLQQLIVNAGIAVDQRCPLCQDTGYVWVLLELGERDAEGRKIAISSSIFSLVDEAVADAYRAARLRMSLACDALVDRSNSNDNTPAFCEVYFNPSKRGATLHVMLKGGGSDNASQVVMLPPGAGLDGVRRVVLDAVREKGASACPPLVIGVGVGSTFDKVASLAKRALLRDISQHNPRPELADLERQLLAQVNALGIGAGGLGGNTTALAVSLLTAPCHIAALPVAVNIGCNSLRSLSIDIDVAGDAAGGLVKGGAA
jgi:tartrate/fumarate subfamily iron-sulfur-dependent hydro-lyase alpha chain